MTHLDPRHVPVPPGAAVPGGLRGRLRGRLRDFGLGVRFAASGGRAGWTRTALTALGVGLGVTLLLGAASVQHIVDARAGRGDARLPTAAAGMPPAADGASLVWADAGTEFHGDTVSGQLLRPDGRKAPLPPGVRELPAADAMVVSPALRDLLRSPGGALLEERLNRRVVGTIADAGLTGPEELRFYAGSSTLSTGNGGERTYGYGSHSGTAPVDPLLVVLIILICVVLLMPVAIFIATAVRFGGDSRDRRLAALRLVGADVRMTRRIAAGEALFGAVLGLIVGAVLFLAARPFAGGIQLWSLSAFPSDLSPAPALTGLIVLAVPASAVLVTLVALRSVTIEPLGVVRDARPRRRKLGWRLLMPVLGVAVLLTTDHVDSTTRTVSPAPITAGAVLLLVGLTALLPWLVEAAVARLHGGPVPWQLAGRRLQLSSGAAARAVSGITVAVAGAIALQMVFGGMQQEFTEATGQDPARADISVSAPAGDGRLAEQMTGEFRDTRGVTAVLGITESYVTDPQPPPAPAVPPTTTLTVGSCATLRELARLPSCRDGDTFVSHIPGKPGMNARVDATARPGRPVNLNTASARDGSRPVLWTLPASARTVQARRDAMGTLHDGILATPGAVDPGSLTGATTEISLRVDHRLPDAAEYVRNTAARIGPALRVWTLIKADRDQQYSTVQTGLLVGGTATMALIAASMLISQIEQLRERRRLLSVLVAFGTRRSTLAWSVLWQTAVPVVLGTALAVLGGLVLGYAMLRMVGKPVRDWWVFAPFAGAGAGVILLVTLLSLPPLLRLMRPEGLRTE